VILPIFHSLLLLLTHAPLFSFDSYLLSTVPIITFHTPTHSIPEQQPSSPTIPYHTTHSQIFFQTNLVGLPSLIFHLFFFLLFCFCFTCIYHCFGHCPFTNFYTTVYYTLKSFFLYSLLLFLLYLFLSGSTVFSFFFY